MEDEHIRTPILQTLRKSPFGKLQEHFKYVKTGIFALEEAVDHYLNKDYKRFKRYVEKIDKYEQKADWIKGNIRNHLPKFIFLPISKADFLSLLKELDGMLDSAKDVTVLMDMRNTEVPEDVKHEFHILIQKVMETVNAIGEVMDMFKIILETSFGGKIRQEIKKMIHEIHKLEHQSDVIEKKISKHLFNIKDIDPISVLHLLKIVERLGYIPDHAENASDKIRAMLAK